MPINALQPRLTQVGVIRLGEKRLSKNNKPYPARLETFRLTSPSRDIIARVAALYGGELRDWKDAPSGLEFQVTTRVNELPVYVLPQRIDPNLELWGNRHRQRYCDGVTERIRNQACLCEAAARQRYERARRPWPEDGRFQRDPRSDCKPTTRLSVLLADVSDGQWKVEAHGWNAAAELPTKATVYLALAQQAVPAVLRLRLRTDAILTIEPDGSEKVESREYVVPELDFGDLFTARQALTGGVDAAVTRALEGQRLAISAAPADLLSALRKEAEDATTPEELRAVWSKTDDLEVRAFITKRAGELAAKPATRPEPVPAPVGAAPEPVVDGEVEPDASQTWMAILTEAGRRNWNTDQTKAAYQQRMGHDADDADGWQLAQFLEALKSGQVAA